MNRIIALILSAALLIFCFVGASAETLFDQIANETPEQQPTTAVKIIDGGVNLLKQDDAISSLTGGAYCILGQSIPRSEIEEIHFINNQSEMSLDAWDVSELQNKTVYAWIVDGTLFISSPGKVVAPASCAYQFAFYRNLKKVEFNGNFDTKNTTDMTGMFAGCESLKEIDLNSLDVSNVTSMASMFESCSSLEKVSASEWQLNSALNSTGIFNGCTSLPYDTIEGTMIEKFEAMEAEAAALYTPIKIGDRGDDVVKLQKRLKALDYGISKADGIYGQKTAAAIHAFKADHNIFDGTKHDETECIASGLMLQALYTMEIPGFEPEIRTPPANLSIVKENAPESEELENNQLKLNFDISSTADQVITAYTLSFYTTDSDGNQSNPASLEFTGDIEPGTIVKSGDIIINDRGRVANLYIGVEKIAYKDGTDFSAPQIGYVAFSAIDWLGEE